MATPTSNGPSRVPASAAVHVDWAQLRQEAIAACQTAYAPYSGYPVGAAALVAGSSPSEAAGASASGGTNRTVFGPGTKPGIGTGVPGATRVVRGCNVENAAYGVTLCAECGLVSELHLTGGGRLTAFVCVDGGGNVIMPCGRCRQLLWEHGGPTMQIETPAGVQTLEQVLPQAFGPENLGIS